MRYVVLGASAAGISGIRELRKLDKESEIILISKDKDIYSRYICSNPVLSGCTKYRSCSGYGRKAFWCDIPICARCSHCIYRQCANEPN